MCALCVGPDFESCKCSMAFVQKLNNISNEYFYGSLLFIAEC